MKTIISNKIKIMKRATRGHTVTAVRALLAILLALGGIGATTGCGQTSFFEVAVAVKSDVPGFPKNCLFSIYSCVATVSGAAADRFPLADKACHTPLDYSLGLFQFETDSDSGNVDFKVEIFDGNNNKLGEGTASSTIKAAGRQAVMLTITPDTTAPAFVACR